MIGNCIRYFSLLHRRTGRLYFDLTALAVFVTTLLIESGKDYASTLMILGGFLAFYSSFMILRQFHTDFSAEAAGIIQRRPGRRGTLTGAFITVVLHAAVYGLPLILISLIDEEFRGQATGTGLLMSLVALLLSMVVACGVILQCVPAFASRSLLQKGSRVILGLVLVSLGIVSTFLEGRVVPPAASFVISHLLPPLNPLITVAMYPESGMNGIIELFYGALYGLVLFRWGLYRWEKQDLMIRSVR